MKDASISNLRTWKKQDIIYEYAASTELQPPEKAILDILRDHLPQMKMLDIGVGGGRTTVHFAQAAEEYWGIDYSEEMIRACRKRFRDASSKVKFAVCDARAMNICPDSFFSLILFSYNGIDYISHEDRFRVFKEVQRVGSAGGLFCFQLTTFRGYIISNLKPSSPTASKRPERIFCSGCCSGVTTTKS